MGAGCGLAHGGWLVLPALSCLQAAPIDACPVLNPPMPCAASTNALCCIRPCPVLHPPNVCRLAPITRRGRMTRVARIGCCEFRKQDAVTSKTMSPTCHPFAYLPRSRIYLYTQHPNSLATRFHITKTPHHITKTPHHTNNPPTSRMKSMRNGCGGMKCGSE